MDKAIQYKCYKKTNLDDLGHLLGKDVKQLYFWWDACPLLILGKLGQPAK